MAPATTNVFDHPQPLGPLAELFSRRSIAVGTDESGNVVLARANTIVVDPGPDPERRRTVAGIVGSLDHSVARALSDEPPDQRLPLIVVPVPGSEQRRVNNEARWSVRPAIDLVKRLADTGVPAELNTVVFGDQSFLGNPLGAIAHWVGEIAFPGETATGAAGRAALLSTAQPAAAPPFLRDTLSIDDGRRQPRVLVLDSGLRTAGGAGIAPEHPALGSCRVHQPWLNDPTIGAADDEDEPDDDGLGLLDFEAGHGTFISGIVRQICPDAEITTAGVLSSFGDGDVASVLRALVRNVDTVGPPDVVIMSFGGFFAGDEPGRFGSYLMGLLGESVGVAAAGNQHTCRPYFPAALPGVIAVGGLAVDGKAWFTNFGPWVDACAPAIDVVSTFFTDFTETVGDEQQRQYDGWARWSGTSFAAPKVAALIAQEMYLDKITAAEAWKRLTSHKQFRYPDLGIVFNV